MAARRAAASADRRLDVAVPSPPPSTLHFKTSTSTLTASRVRSSPSLHHLLSLPPRPPPFFLHCHFHFHFPFCRPLSFRPRPPQWSLSAAHGPRCRDIPYNASSLHHATCPRRSTSVRARLLLSILDLADTPTKLLGLASFASSYKLFVFASATQRHTMRLASALANSVHPCPPQPRRPPKSNVTTPPRSPFAASLTPGPPQKRVLGLALWLPDHHWYPPLGLHSPAAPTAADSPRCAALHRTGLSLATLTFAVALAADLTLSRRLFLLKNLLSVTSAPLEVLITILYWSIMAVSRRRLSRLGPSLIAAD